MWQFRIPPNRVSDTRPRSTAHKPNIPREFCWSPSFFSSSKCVDLRILKDFWKIRRFSVGAYKGWIFFTTPVHRIRVKTYQPPHTHTHNLNPTLDQWQRQSDQLSPLSIDWAQCITHICLLCCAICVVCRAPCVVCCVPRVVCRVLCCGVVCSSVLHHVVLRGNQLLIGLLTPHLHITVYCSIRGLTKQTG